MKIKSLEMSWFRGASGSISFGTDSKNVVVYGINGSGKSSFVDALEYIINDGKIEHLAHEYSGSRQKKSILNTHIPQNSNASIKLVLTNDDNIVVEIQSSGKKSFTSEPDDLIKTLQSWKIENYILRQDEVSKFIHLTKGEKYSVLLPLLGLAQLEKAADNFKRLHLRIKKDSKEETVRNRLDRLKVSIGQYFDNPQDPVISSKISELCADYDLSYSGDVRTDSYNLLHSINDKINNISPDNTRYQLLKQCNDEQVQFKFKAYEESKTSLAVIASEIIDRKIEVLQAASEYLLGVKEEGKITCPACGQTIDSVNFRAHIESEMSQLDEARRKKQQYEEKEKEFLDSFDQVLKLLGSEELNLWMIENSHDSIIKKVEELKTKLEKSEDIEYTVELAELYGFIEKELGESPPEISGLLNDRAILLAIRTIPGISALETYFSNIKSTIDMLKKCESSTHSKIKEQAEIKIREITSKLQETWRKIHPDEPIEDVRLYIPQNADKAIDISLKFFGLEQPSPRVTLSEGHRNSLGLCIFLALALGNKTDDPIILDDIVSSLDREHRNRIIPILRNDLADRQIILFTHDRSWYTELHYLLPQRDWKFLVLNPWNNPSTGIQWSRSSYSFDDARALLPEYPEPGGNVARAIMDSHMSVIAEKIQILLPHLRGVNNDRRTCIEYFKGLIPMAKSSYKIKKNGAYSIHTDAIDKLEGARDLILAYGNPASHGREVVPSEVTQLIDACEAALNYFKCPDCGDYVWMSDQSTRERLQCPCGSLRWQYG